MTWEYKTIGYIGIFQKILLSLSDKIDSIYRNLLYFEYCTLIRF
ncbi:protein of unknown function [Chryseobacterium sp. JV274]|nr:protein of unknown function [Chryseobacterium sp. JV274]